MRHLFVPACLCLMTLSTATGSIPAPTTEISGSKDMRNAEPASPATDANAKNPLPDNAHDGADAASSANAAPVVIQIPRDDKIENAAAPATPAAPASEPVARVVFTTEAVPLPKAKPEMKPIIWRTHAEICDSLSRAALANDMPAPFVIRLLLQESGFHPGVVSKAGAQGIAQFMPDTAGRMGVDNPFDPLEAIPASVQLLRNLFEKFGNLGLAAAAYNAGPKRIQDWLAKKGVLPQETQGYVKTITGRPAETWKVTQAGTPAVRLPRQAPCQETAGLLAWNGPEQIPMPPTREQSQPVAVAAKPAKDAPQKDSPRKDEKIALAKNDGGKNAKHNGADAFAKETDKEIVKEAPQQIAAADVKDTKADHRKQARKAPDDKRMTATITVKPEKVASIIKPEIVTRERAKPTHAAGKDKTEKKPVQVAANTKPAKQKAQAKPETNARKRTAEAKETVQLAAARKQDRSNKPLKLTSAR